MPAPRADGCGNTFLLVWLIGWSVVVVIFDGFLVAAVFQQVRALTFPTTDGVVTRSEVRTADDTNRLDVAYEYEVGGRRFTGTRYSYAEMGTNTRAWHRIADEMPVGSKARVSYDPDTPAESLLRPGPTGFHLMLVWFLTPFNLIMVGGWVFAARARRPAFGPHSIKPIDGGYRVRLPAFSRAGCGACVLLPVTFVGSFVWAFGFGFNPPVELAGWLYVATVAIAVVVTVSVPLPQFWIEVNELIRVVRFPADPDPLEVPFAAIRDVTVRHEEKKDSEGDVTHAYHCELIRPDEQPLHIAEYSDPEAAAALAAWLRERIGLVSPSAPP